MTDGISEPGPTVCPRCAKPGYVEYIDLVSRVTHFGCRACGARWRDVDPADAAKKDESIIGRSTRTGLAERLAAAERDRR